MRRIKKRIFSGCICEQIIYNVKDTDTVRTSKPRLRFANDDERRMHREGIVRRAHARMINETFSPSPTSFYSTLTFDAEYEVHTFPEARRLRDNYYRRLTYAHPEAKIVLYMGRGRGTNRIHFHMISEGIPKNEIIRLWGMGGINEITNLRSHCYYADNGKGQPKTDHGPDYTALANYLYDHWTPEQGGRHYKATRNTRKPDEEAPTECHRVYTPDKPPRPPKGYMIIDAASKMTTYGYHYYKYVKIPEKDGARRTRQNT